MSQITDGLLNGGKTQHFAISYESSLSAADGRSVAQGLMNVIEGDLAVVTGWFAGTAFKFAYPIEIELHNATGGASWQNPPDLNAALFHPTVVVKAVNSGGPGEEAEQGLDFVRYLLIMEVTEMFMTSKDNGWAENTTLTTAGDEGSKGEGLSRFLGHQFALVKGITAHYPGYEVVHDWLTSATRTNYVEGSPDDHQPDPVTGGTTCFIYYLHDQLGFPIPAIIDAGSTTLAGVYQKLTGRADAWQSFISLVDAHYPASTTQDDMGGDDIFPVANLRSMDNGVSVAAGGSAKMFLTLDRATPVSVSVQLTSDDPTALAVPPSVRIPYGHQDSLVTVVAQPITGAARMVTVHASYAGTTVSAAVHVVPSASELGGVVSDAASGAPIAGAVVLVDGTIGMTSPSHVHMQLVTASDGSWTTGPVAPDTYMLEVTASGYVTAKTSVVVSEGVPSTRRNLELTASKAFTVRGTVTDQTGAPLSGVAVTLIEDAGNLRLSATTAANGAYNFSQDPGVYTGGYTLSAELAGHTRAQLAIPTISNGATVLQNITLTALAVLTGLITDATTKAPLAGAQVTAGAAAAVSDATGHYTVQVAPGSVSINVAANGFEVGTASVAVAPASTVERDIALVEASATVTGTVLDTGTELGVRGAFVRVTGATGVQSSVGGGYTISRVPAGPAQIVASAPGYGTETVPVQVVAHETLSVNIYLASARPNPHPPQAA